MTLRELLEQIREDLNETQDAARAGAKFVSQVLRELWNWLLDFELVYYLYGLLAIVALALLPEVIRGLGDFGRRACDPEEWHTVQRKIEVLLGLVRSQRPWLLFLEAAVVVTIGVLVVLVYAGIISNDIALIAGSISLLVPFIGILIHDWRSGLWRRG